MNKQELEAFVREAKKSIKTEAGLKNFRKILTTYDRTIDIKTPRDRDGSFTLRRFKKQRTPSSPCLQP